VTSPEASAPKPDSSITAVTTHFGERAGPYDAKREVSALDRDIFLVMFVKRFQELKCLLGI
jgi:hypothetical protein